MYSAVYIGMVRATFKNEPIKWHLQTLWCPGDMGVGRGDWRNIETGTNKPSFQNEAFTLKHWCCSSVVLSPMEAPKAARPTSCNVCSDNAVVVIQWCHMGIQTQNVVRLRTMKTCNLLITGSLIGETWHRSSMPWQFVWICAWLNLNKLWD